MLKPEILVKKIEIEINQILNLILTTEDKNRRVNGNFSANYPFFLITKVN